MLRNLRNKRLVFQKYIKLEIKSNEHASHVLFFIRVSKIFTDKMSRVILGGWEPVIGYVFDAFLHDASPM